MQRVQRVNVCLIFKTVYDNTSNTIFTVYLQEIPLSNFPPSVAV